MFHTFRSLEHRNYRLYFIGQGISLIGSWMQTTALMWLAYEMTHQARWPAFISVAMIGPTFLLGPWAGKLADRYPKFQLIVRTQFGFLLTTTLLTIIVALDWVTPWILLIMMAAHGIVQAIDLPARLAFVPELVPREYLINTVALNSVQFNLARAVGPALTGVILRFVGIKICFLLNALSYIAVLFALKSMRDIPKNSLPKHDAPALEGGFRILRNNPRLFTLVLLTGLVAISGWPLLALLPAYAERVLHRKDLAYSQLLSAVGVGALLGALTAATFSTEQRRQRLLVIGAGFVMTGLLGIAQVDELSAALGCTGLFGFGMILFFSTGQAAVQLSVSSANRGKIMGVWAMMLSGGVPLGNLIYGPAADEWGVARVIFTEGLMMSIVFGLLLCQGIVSKPLLKNN